MASIETLSVRQIKVFEIIIWLQKCRDLEHRVRGLSRSLEMSSFDRAHSTSYWCSKVTMALSRVVSEIGLFNVERCRDLNPGQRLKIIGTDTDRSATYEWLAINVTKNNNHEPILRYRFRDKWHFSRKSPIFSPRDLTPPLKGFALELGTDARDQKARMMGLPDGQKRIKIGLAV